MINSVVLQVNIRLDKLHSKFRVPNIHPSFKIAMTPSKWYASELNVLEVHCLNKSWSTRVEAMKLYHFVWYEHIWGIFPRVFFQPKFSSLDQILVLTMTVIVQNFLYFSLFLSIDNNRVWRWLWTSSKYGILSGGNKLDSIEYWM